MLDEVSPVTHEQYAGFAKRDLMQDEVIAIKCLAPFQDKNIIDACASNDFMYENKLYSYNQLKQIEESYNQISNIRKNVNCIQVKVFGFTFIKTLRKIKKGEELSLLKGYEYWLLKWLNTLITFDTIKCLYWGKSDLETLYEKIPILRMISENDSAYGKIIFRKIKRMLSEVKKN
jgi:hypothetical protein